MTPVPLVPAAGPAQQGQEVPLILAGWQDWCLHPCKPSPPASMCSVRAFWRFCLDFCFPFAGSDVALAPVVTCFITSSFNNVSTDPDCSFQKRSLSSSRASCAVSPLQGQPQWGSRGEQGSGWEQSPSIPCMGGMEGSLPHQ